MIGRLWLLKKEWWVETSPRRGREDNLVSEGAPTARTSTHFHFESQDHADRADDREYSLLLPDETTESRHPLGKA